MAQAIYNLEPGCKFGIRVNEEQELYPVWKEGDDLPSDSELNTEINRLNNEYDGQEYYRNRAEDYLAIGDQLDLIWHAIDEDEDLKTKTLDAWVYAIKQSPLEPNDLKEIAAKYRKFLFEEVASYDEHLMEKYLDGQKQVTSPHSSHSSSVSFTHPWEASIQWIIFIPFLSIKNLKETPLL